MYEAEDLGASAESEPGELRPQSPSSSSTLPSSSSLLSDNIIVIIIPFKVNHALKLSDIRGWSLLSEDPVSMIAIHIPEEDR